MKRIMLLGYALVFYQVAYSQDSSTEVRYPDRWQGDSSILGQLQRDVKTGNFQAINPIKKDEILNLFSIEASYDMTTHIIFPYEIIYVDLGSTYIVSQKVDKVGNVLKLKANKKDFSPTTMTVITSDGQFFSFMVSYAAFPKVLNINLGKAKLTSRKNVSDKNLPATGPGTAISLINKTGMNEGEMDGYAGIAIKKKRKLFHIGEEKYHMDVAIDNIFIRDNIFFLCFSFDNHSQVDYDFDFVKFFIRDKKLLKRTAQQELEIMPLHIFDPLGATTVKGDGSIKKVACFQRFTVFDDKDVYVEIFEKNGGRTFIFNITNEDLIRAKKI